MNSFAKVPTGLLGIMARERVTDRSFKVLTAMLTFVRPGRTDVFPSQETLCGLTDMSPRTMKRAVKEIRTKLGVVVATHRTPSGNLGNVYKLGPLLQAAEDFDFDAVEQESDGARAGAATETRSTPVTAQACPESNSVPLADMENANPASRGTWGIPTFDLPAPDGNAPPEPEPTPIPESVAREKVERFISAQSGRHYIGVFVGSPDELARASRVSPTVVHAMVEDATLQVVEQDGWRVMTVGRYGGHILLNVWEQLRIDGRPPPLREPPPPPDPRHAKPEEL
jgi:hypothetical protein